MTSPPGPLNLTKLLAIAEECFGSPLPMREIALLESAAAHPGGVGFILTQRHWDKTRIRWQAKTALLLGQKVH